MKKKSIFNFSKKCYELWKKDIFWAWKIFRTKFCFFFTMNIMSENDWNHEKRHMWNLFKKRSKLFFRKFRNRTAFKTLTSNTRELVDSNFNQLSFIQAMGAEALVRGVVDKVPYETGGIGGGDRAPLYVKNCDESFFAQISVKISQSYFLRFQAFSKSFEKKMQPCFFHDSKSSMNFLSILNKKKLCSKFSKNICLSKPLTFFGKV